MPAARTRHRWIAATTAAAMRVCTLAATWPLCSAAFAENALPTLPPPLLRPAEKRAAFTAVTTANLAPFGVSTPSDPSRRVVTGIISADTKAAGGSSQARLALVVQYDYDLRGSLTSLVDVATRNVVSMVTTANDTPPLAASEDARAAALALGDPRVRDALAAVALSARVDAGVSVISDRQDPMYGYRIARVLFRTNAGYMGTPFAVYVDLTNNVVHLR